MAVQRIQHHIFELVAPTIALSAIFVLLFGPLLFPRAYIWFLLIYFITYLYISMNHFLKFCHTVRNIKRTIRNWNASQNQSSTHNHKEEIKSTSTSNGRITPTRNGYASVSTSDDFDCYNRANEMESADKIQDAYYIHAFVIPNYEEPEPLLRDTIKRLAQHRNATDHYVIVLAMEASEVDHRTKADNLRRAFDGSFLDFIITIHPKDLPGESRGKGSNVAYAARAACDELVRKGIDKRRVVFTVTDSDSAIPELYIRHVEKAFAESYDPYAIICSPPIFFSRNALNVPAAVRVTDIMWSIMVMQNLSNRKGLAFPCSTYSLSMVLAEQVGFWDTDKDAIGEDLHMWLKCFFKTGGISRTIPIYVPINLTNVQTTGYISNIHARWVQAKRHYNGVADVAYSLKFAFGVSKKSPDTKSLLGSYSGQKFFMSCSLADKLTVVFHVLEAHMIPATSGWIMFAAVPLTQFLLISTYSPLSNYYPSFQNPILTSTFYYYMFCLIQAVSILLPMPLLMCAALYEGLHKTIDVDLLKKSSSETRTWRNVVDYAWLPVSAWLFLTLPSTMACVKRLIKCEEQYVVAEKIFSEELTR
ncbi:255_t:CDS:2 [Funneliformis mosseae]|uniref:255_t:CDS:1 n=1 Tax=Funneliformis mosseae TaxID=27381 RepID=A0A9N9AZZ2_FUNMO|nr:255_t:CDS:2 [Funneliformis mosseae]